jgi:DMSO/TMAO reductase YedYZ molybdopterin-dependent catalytic subunit
VEVIDAPLAALIDCTGGWYSTQRWSGVPLTHLLDLAGTKPGARSIIVQGVTGYQRAFDLQAARTFLLATHVAGQSLEHGHGFPLRLVAPGHRGFDWVKWVTSIEVSETSYIVQPPVPLQ